MLDLLGKGGFACVYRAKCKNNGVEVAIKMVRLDSVEIQKKLQSSGHVGNTPLEFINSDKCLA